MIIPYANLSVSIDAYDKFMHIRKLLDMESISKREFMDLIADTYYENLMTEMKKNNEKFANDLNQSLIKSPEEISNMNEKEIKEEIERLGLNTEAENE